MLIRTLLAVAFAALLLSPAIARAQDAVPPPPAAPTPPQTPPDGPQPPVIPTN